MKDEEMAEQFADSYATPDLEGSFRAHLFEASKDGFLAGLKAGRPQWHDLRKDPNDLPEEYIPVLNQYGEHISYDGHYWRDCDDIIYTNVIAWCEIPTFDKE